MTRDTRASSPLARVSPGAASSPAPGHLSRSPAGHYPAARCRRGLLPEDDEMTHDTPNFTSPRLSRLDAAPGDPCATTGCPNRARITVDRGGVASRYCADCYGKIDWAGTVT